jgi:26S proteasome regulatory subunit N2
MYAVGLAYVGTGNNNAVAKLLHVAVSDVNDDVRRAAVHCLGLVLCNVPSSVPRIVGLLAESFNAHVRYGAALAVGTACAATGMKEALALLEPLCKDRVDFVRQAAFIGMAMVLIQHNEVKEPKVKTVRKMFVDALSLKGDTMTKFGAILASGIMDAGGRNVTISLLSSAGHKKMAAIVGMVMFPQFWFWYPYVHFISLSFTPTAVIALNKDVKIPKQFQFISRGRPSLFAYPPPIELKKVEEKKKVKTATLSVTAKAKARAIAKKREKGEEGGDSMETENVEAEKDMKDDKAKESDKKEEKKEETEEEKKKREEEEKKKKEPEAEFEILKNPARVTWSQQPFITFDRSQRYIPVKQRLAAIIMLKDGRPEEAEDFVVPTAPKIGVPGISDDEPEPPAPFEFTR